MRIYESGFGGTSGVASAQAANTGKNQSVSSTGGSSSGNDHVELSSALGTLSRALSSFGSGRTQRVQALAAQYHSGQYKVDAAAVSKAMLSAAVTAGAGGETAAGGASR